MVSTCEAGTIAVLELGVDVQFPEPRLTLLECLLEPREGLVASKIGTPDLAWARSTRFWPVARSSRR